jgi:hypothetical protein
VNADEYTGTLRRGEQEGELRGFLINLAGVRIEFSGFRDPRPGHGYTLIGRVVSDGRQTQDRRAPARMADGVARRPAAVPMGIGQAAAKGREA